MEPPLQPPPQPPQAPAHGSYPDSVDSSPRSRTTDTWDEPLPPVPGGSKLRLMCSYGGHIVPRPHDKSLCYVGGDTRIVVVDRQNASLSDLSSRLSKTLLNNGPFTLKYQLPNEDLDSLISVTTDEDLDNMIDEYDRICSNSSSLKFSRIRLFLFPTKPESTTSLGSILDNSIKSEDWFLDALNGTGVLNRGFSDSQTVNCLLGLENEVVGGGGGGGGGSGGANDGSRELLDGSQAEMGSFKNAAKPQSGGQDVHSVPDSPMLDTTSSFGSTSSSPSLANLPPIRVHVEDQKLGIEEQFAQISVAGGKQDEGFVVMSSPPPPRPTSAAISAVPASFIEYPNRAFSDDERSEQGIAVGYRRPPQPQLLPQLQTLPPQSQPKPTGGVDLASPDSVSSDSSLTNAISRQKPMIYQDSVVQISSGRVSGNPVDPKISMTDPNSRVQIQQVQEPVYILQSQLEQQQQHQQQQHLLQHQQHQQQLQLQQQQHHQQQQHQQQFINAGAHYIQQYPTGQVPMSSYYPVYPSQQQHHQQLDQPQQYPVFFVPNRQPAQQAYNLSMQQPNFNEAPNAVPPTRSQTPPNPSMIPASAAYNPARNAPPQKTESGAAGVYRTAAQAPPQLIQVNPSQPQQQYVGYSQVHHPSQSVASNSPASANYGYEYGDPAHAQMYYTQPLAPTMHPHYQTMTSNPAVVLPETSSQLTNDNIKQQNRTSQAL